MTSDLGGVTINEKIYPPNNVPHTGELERQIQALKDMGFVVSYPTLKGPDGYYQATSDKDGKALVSADPNQSGVPYLPSVRLSPVLQNVVPLATRTIAASRIVVPIPPAQDVLLLFFAEAWTGAAPKFQLGYYLIDTHGDDANFFGADATSVPYRYPLSLKAVAFAPMPSPIVIKLAELGTTTDITWGLDIAPL